MIYTLKDCIKWYGEQRGIAIFSHWKKIAKLIERHSREKKGTRTLTENELDLVYKLTEAAGMLERYRDQLLYYSNKRPKEKEVNELLGEIYAIIKRWANP